MGLAKYILKNEPMAKPGPKPKYGETRKNRTVRLTDDCYDWYRSFDNPGAILENIYQSSKRKAFKKWYENDVLPEVSG